MTDKVIKFLKERYYAKNDNSWEDIANRVSTIYDIKKYMMNGDGCPSTPTLQNANNPDSKGTLSSCFPLEIKDSMEGINEFFNDVWWVTKAGGGCVAKGSMVILKDKGYIPIEDVKVGDFILSFNIINKSQEFKEVIKTHLPIIHIEDNIKIKLQRNIELITSKTHPVLIYRDEKLQYVNAVDILLTDLLINDNLGTINRTFNDKEIAWFIGCHLGDGHAYYVGKEYKVRGKDYVRKHEMLRVGNMGDNKKVVDKYCEILNKNSKTNLVVNELSENRKTKVFECRGANKGVTKFIEKYFGLYGKKTGIISVPKFIMDADDETKYSFIAGLIDSDGYVDIQKEDLAYYTISDNMLKTFSLLLNSLNAKFYVRTRIQDGKKSTVLRENSIIKPLHEIIISSANTIQKIFPYIIHDIKKNKISKFRGAKGINFNSIIMTNDLYNYIIKNAVKIKGTNQYNNKAINSFKKYHGNTNKQQSIQHNRLKFLIENIKEHNTKEIYDELMNKIEFAKRLISIKNIEYNNNVDSQFYDVTVKDNNNYFTGFGGLSVMHNCGSDFSCIRSKGENIKSVNSPTSGIIPFIRLKSATLETVSQGAKRRGAGGILLDYYHPEILDYIRLKSDPNDHSVDRCNLSVSMYKEFYDILENNPNELMFVKEVVSGKKKPLLDDKGKQYTYKKLWDEIIYNAWKSAEPNIYNLGLALEQCTTKNYINKVTPNPCLKDDATVLTKNGIRTIKDLNIGDEIWSKEGWTTVLNKFPTGNKEVFKYKTTHGYFESTDNHEVEQNGKKIEVKTAKGIDVFELIEDEMIVAAPSPITSYSSMGFHDVWDITVDNNSHTFWCQGFSISNCTEYISHPNSSCSLASLNLSNFVLNPFTPQAKLDIPRLKQGIKDFTILLDSTLDVNNFPLEKIREVTLNIRAIGLGYMGLAHMLMKLNYSYIDDDAMKLMRKLSRYFTFVSMETSIELAKEKEPYPVYDFKTYVKANERFFKDKDTETIWDIKVKDIYNNLKKHGIRNSSQTSIAPTGSISHIMETSSGLEPIYALLYNRKIEIGVDANGDKQYRIEYIIDQVFEEYISLKYKYNYKEIFDEISKLNGSCQDSKILTKKEKAIFITAKDMSPLQHLETLSMITPNISLSASKTINLPNNAKQNEISDIYKLAFKKGIIGVSVYRDGSRQGVLSSSEDKIISNKLIDTLTNGKKNIDGDEEIIKKELKLPTKSISETFTVKSEGKKWYFTVTYFDDSFKPFGVFISTNHKLKTSDVKSSVNDLFQLAKYKGISDKIINNQLEKIKDVNNVDKFARALSLCLRHGISIKNIINTIDKGEHVVGSLIFHTSKFLKSFLDGKVIKGEKCPDCGSKVIYYGGCKECEAKCGWDACG